MAKNNLPSVDDSPAAKQSAPVERKQVIEAPTTVTEGYLPRRVDVKLTRDQARILRDKVRLLQDTGATTADGRFVSNRTQAVQWILENEVSL
jgi:hypothetical protein